MSLITIAISFITFLPVLASAKQPEATSIQKELAELEAPSGGRIGLYAINTGNNMRLQYRANERFPFCSTFKVMTVAAILKRSMTDDHLLSQRIKYRKEDIDIVWSPITEKHVADGMSISELSAAAVM